jgi:hypothetical protein
MPHHVRRYAPVGLASVRGAIDLGQDLGQHEMIPSEQIAQLFSCSVTCVHLECLAGHDPATSCSKGRFGFARGIGRGPLPPAPKSLPQVPHYLKESAELAHRLNAMQPLQLMPQLASYEVFNPAGCRRHAKVPRQQGDWLATERDPRPRGGVAMRVSSPFSPSHYQFGVVALALAPAVGPPAEQCSRSAGRVALGMIRPDRIST